MMEIAGSHTNGTMEDADSSKRDIKNHMLFEISTEAANRGGKAFCDEQNKALTTSQLEESTL